MHETELRLVPGHASDLCPLLAPEVLTRHGWDRAFVTVLDEAPVEDAIVVLGHGAGSHPGEDWHAIKVRAKATRAKGRTEDAEACALHDGWVHLRGSQFGAEQGPLEARRSWIARVREGDLAKAAGRRRLRIEVARLRFGIHRAVNDALAASQTDLVALGPATREAYIDATIALGAKKGKRWSGRVRSSDHPIGVGGADFRSDGRLLLGLRYPVSGQGHPMLVELDDVDTLYRERGSVPTCTNVWVLEDMGSAEQPVAVHALRGEGSDRFNAVVGDLDGPGKGATILADHPEGADVVSMHVSFELPLVAAGGSVATERVRDFVEGSGVEGVAMSGDGNAHYLVDADGHAALRTVPVG
jgi:hypothetical protein